MKFSNAQKIIEQTCKLNTFADPSTLQALIQAAKEDPSARGPLADYLEEIRDPRADRVRRMDGDKFRYSLRTALQKPTDMSVPARSAEIGEIKSWIGDNEQLDRQKDAIITNLARKIKRGVYDPTLASKLWMYLVDAAVKSYRRYWGMNQPIANKETQWHLADQLAVEWTPERIQQEYPDLFTEKFAKDDYIPGIDDPSKEHKNVRQRIEEERSQAPQKRVTTDWGSGGSPLGDYERGPRNRGFYTGLRMRQDFIPGVDDPANYKPDEEEKQEDHAKRDKDNDDLIPGVDFVEEMADPSTYDALQTAIVEDPADEGGWMAIADYAQEHEINAHQVSMDLFHQRQSYRVRTGHSPWSALKRDGDDFGADEYIRIWGKNQKKYLGDAWTGRWNWEKPNRKEDFEDEHLTYAEIEEVMGFEEFTEDDFNAMVQAAQEQGGVAVDALADYLEEHRDLRAAKVREIGHEDLELALDDQPPVSGYGTWIGDEDYLAAVTIDHHEGNISGNEDRGYTIAELNNVPFVLWNRLVKQGESDQHYSDGYDAATAAAPYAGAVIEHEDDVMWEVVVGNVGTVYVGTDEDIARNYYDTYVNISQNDQEGAGVQPGVGSHRAYQEEVVLLHGEDIIEQHYPDGPGEEDITAEDPDGPFYYEGKEVAADREELKKWMEDEGIYPNVWWISDHGNPHQITDLSEKFAEADNDALEQALRENPNDQGVRHALMDSYIESGMSQEEAGHAMKEVARDGIFTLDEAMVPEVWEGTEREASDPEDELEYTDDALGNDIGWLARLSMPGYMDATDTAWFETEQEAYQYLLEQYGSQEEQRYTWEREVEDYLQENFGVEPEAFVESADSGEVGYDFVEEFADPSTLDALIQAVLEDPWDDSRWMALADLGEEQGIRNLLNLRIWEMFDRGYPFAPANPDTKLDPQRYKSRMEGLIRSKIEQWLWDYNYKTPEKFVEV